MESITILFVLPEGCNDESEASEVMLQAYESCKQTVANVSWIHQSELEAADFPKTHFVVFQDFHGSSFEKIKNSKCAILGPLCVSVCLMEGRPIPNYPWPIYNVAMSNCIVACSHISKENRAAFKQKIEAMGGCYTEGLLSTNTHLITDSVKSEKYSQAVEAGLTVMIPEWVEAVWKASQANNVHADHKQFANYRCLPFHNLTVCSTGIKNSAERKELAQIVVKNGGVFTGSLNLSNTDILVVCEPGGSVSPKFIAARKVSNIHCVMMDWIKDSAAQGCALPCHLYGVKVQSTSTPTKEVIDPNFSTLSAIAGPSICSKTTLEETVNPSEVSWVPNKVSPNKRKGSDIAALGLLVDGLDVKKAKKAGQYLDGCSVYLAGFDGEQREKLCKVLNLSGATRYDHISERLTHIIIGDRTCPEVKAIALKNYPACLVSLYWLLDSINNSRPVDEENYLINLNEIGKANTDNSPLGRKGLNLLRTNQVLTESDLEAANACTRTNDPIPEEDIMQQYAKSQSNKSQDTLAELLKDAGSRFDSPSEATATMEHNSARTETQDTVSNATSQTVLFENLKFLLTTDIEPSCRNYFEEQIEEYGGIIVSNRFSGIPDYVVSPMIISSGIQHTATELVNDQWVLQSIHEGELCKIEYYHRPYVIKGTEPLAGCVVTISSYTGCERVFLNKVIQALGGVASEQLARISRPEKNIVGSTHLVSKDASGKKYEAALKWGLPVVSNEWLMECARTGLKVPEENFLVGEASMSQKSNVRKRQLSSLSTPGTSGTNSMVCVSRTPGVLPTMVDGGATPLATPEISVRDKTVMPLNESFKANCSSKVTTPVNRPFKVGTDSPISQVTPVNQIMEKIRQSHQLGTPASPKCWFDVDTPTTPLGAFLRPNPSPDLRKNIQRFINEFPDFVPPRRASTPLSELKKRLYNKLCDESITELNNQSQDTDNNISIGEDNQRSAECSFSTKSELKSDSENFFINNKLKELENMVNSSGDKKRTSRGFQSKVLADVSYSEPKDSQPLTVGWDFTEENPSKLQRPEGQAQIFMISGLENKTRQDYVMKLESLGATVSDLANYDPSCTHLICSKPGRNEKTLACMASGKWILHTSYVDKSIAAGRFLNEEEFEFGNPKAKENFKLDDADCANRVKAIYEWRKEISRRGYGAFNDMRAIVIAKKREPIVNVIEAGGGVVIDVKPPFEDSVHATHCLLEPKSVSDFSLYIPLAQQGIFCVNTMYISDCLHKTNKDITDCILPHLTKYYAHN